jgi:DNA-directed RNA polymerase specialized sigma24 family protein
MASAELTPETNIDYCYELENGFAARYIAFKARKLSRCTGFLRHEEYDLCRELQVLVFKRLPKFDPTAGCFNAWVKMVVDHHCLTLRRNALSQRRRCSYAESLSSLFEDAPGEAEPLSERLGQEDQDRLTGKASVLPHDEVDLKLDVATVVENLPPRLQRIAQLLMTHSVAEIARKLKLWPRNIYAAIKELRKTFADAGLQEYVGNFCTGEQETE